MKYETIWYSWALVKKTPQEDNTFQLFILAKPIIVPSPKDEEVIPWVPL